MEEIALIGSARQGDLEAFNRLVLTHQDAVYNQAFWILGSREAAEDATQEAFIRAYQNLPRFRNGFFLAWLLRIVTNTCVDELRRTNKQPTRSLIARTIDGEEFESPSWLIDPCRSVEETVELRDLKALLVKCLAELPAEQRMLVLMVDVFDFDYKEAASVLRVPVGTVKSRLARSRLLLRNLFERHTDRGPSEWT